ncbi:MAG: T9SS type A sorting domain-containing protein [Prolixibacteraceae bacterium]
MKKTILIFILILFASGLYSQNWTLFPKNQESVFKYDIGDKIIINKFHLDSSTYQDRMVYFYNDTIVKKIDFEEAFKVTKYSIEFFLMKDVNQKGLFAYYDWKGDTMNFYQYNIDDVIIEKVYEFMPFTQPGESWETESSKISCTKIYWGEVLGKADSLKTFTVEYNDGSLSEITLSKNYGLLKFVPLDRLAWDNAKMPADKYYELIGLTREGKQTAYQTPDFPDYFNLNPGDVKYWKDYSIVAESTYGYLYRKDSIVKVLRNNDEVMYTIARQHYDANFNYQAEETLTESFISAKEGVCINGQPQSFNHASWNGFDNGFFAVTQIYQSINGVDTTTNLEYVWAPFGIYNDSIFQFIDAGFALEVYATPAGLIYSATGGDEMLEFEVTEPIAIESTVIGTCINGIESGSTQFIPTGIKEISENELSVYPNPVKNVLNVPVNLANIHKVQIINLSGMKVMEVAGNSRIDVHELLPGVYTIRVIGIDGSLYRSKFIKQ